MIQFVQTPFNVFDAVLYLEYAKDVGEWGGKEMEMECLSLYGFLLYTYFFHFIWFFLFCSSHILSFELQELKKKKEKEIFLFLLINNVTWLALKNAWRNEYKKEKKGYLSWLFFLPSYTQGVWKSTCVSHPSFAASRRNVKLNKWRIQLPLKRAGSLTKDPAAKSVSSPKLQLTWVEANSALFLFLFPIPFVPPPSPKKIKVWH